MTEPAPEPPRADARKMPPLEVTPASGVAFPPEVVTEVRTRLRRAGGQVQAVERMLDEGRDCTEVITQLSAAIHALEQAGYRLLAAGLASCFEAAGGKPSDEARELFEKLFSKLT
jgi:DNA-binding FrmR family transcriptional regulator